MIDIKKYKTWIFDCDGVVLDSNDIKTEAFYEIALPHGIDKAKRLVAYHKKFGGISRFEKLQYFFKHILQREDFDNELKNALKRYGVLAKRKLMRCPGTTGLRAFLKRIPKEKRKIIVSGGAEIELRDIFAKRKLDRYFNAIYGSPDNKKTILRRLLKRRRLHLPAVFVGDTKYDYQCSKAVKIDFIFMHQYTEFKNWRDYFKKKKIFIIPNLKHIK